MDWIVNSLLVHFLCVDIDESGEIRIQLVLLKTILHEKHANLVFICNLLLVNRVSRSILPTASSILEKMGMLKFKYLQVGFGM